METILGFMIGIGLSAACGFRVFVPLLGMSIAALSGNMILAEGFEWMGSWPAFIAFTTATIMEICAYYIPWVDHLMDTITTPAAIVAGTIMTASIVKDVSPFLKWSLAIIAGGGTAGIIQVGSVLLRGTSSTITGGLGNFAVSTLELIGSIILTVLAITIPLLAIIFVVFIVYKNFSSTIRKKASSQKAGQG